MQSPGVPVELWPVFQECVVAVLIARARVPLGTYPHLFCIFSLSNLNACTIFHLLWWCNLRPTLHTVTVACCQKLVQMVDENTFWASTHRLETCHASPVPTLTFAQMCRGGRMFAPTKTWRRWHRKINVTQKRYAICSALAATALPALVMAKGEWTEHLLIYSCCV